MNPQALKYYWRRFILWYRKINNYCEKHQCYPQRYLGCADCFHEHAVVCNKQRRQEKVNIIADGIKQAMAEGVDVSSKLMEIGSKQED